jgi:hypothetical protein
MPTQRLRFSGDDIFNAGGSRQGYFRERSEGDDIFASGRDGAAHKAGPQNDFLETVTQWVRDGALCPVA